MKALKSKFGLAGSSAAALRLHAMQRTVGAGHEYVLLRGPHGSWIAQLVVQMEIGYCRRVGVRTATATVLSLSLSTLHACTLVALTSSP